MDIGAGSAPPAGSRKSAAACTVVAASLGLAARSSVAFAIAGPGAPAGGPAGRLLRPGAAAPPVQGKAPQRADDLCGGSFFPLALGLAGGAALRALVVRRARGGDPDPDGGYRSRGGYGGGYGGGGGFYGGGGSKDDRRANQADMREAKRRRETDQFFSFQKSFLRSRSRREVNWDAKERELFKAAHVKRGINFDHYDDIPVERIGGKGDEKICEKFSEFSKEFELPQALVDNIERCGYDVPTPVQKHSISAALGGTDVMVSAQTGSGKTAAFLVPMVATAMRAGKKEFKEGPMFPTSVILAPTRELVQQITIEAERLCFRSEISVASVYGGADAPPQLKNMAQGCEIVVATPGRLDDFIDRGVISMEQVKYLALDEADRMLDMGFDQQIERIIQNYGMPPPGAGPEERQTMMFSATFPKEMQDLALNYLDPSYLWISVGKVGGTVSDVEQTFEDISLQREQERLRTLVDTIGSVKGAGGRPAKTIVFANQKNIVDDLQQSLYRSRIRATQIHGGMTQAARDNSLARLKRGDVDVLVATDVAARGLDVPDVGHVINYQLPNNPEDYVHRIGRTGRIGNKGKATSFVDGTEPSLKGICQGLMAASGDGTPVEVPEWLQQKASRGRDSGSRGRSRSPGGYGGRSRSPSYGSYGGRGRDRYDDSGDDFGSGSDFYGGGSRDRYSGGGSRDRYGGGDRYSSGGGRDRYSGGGSRDRYSSGGGRDRYARDDDGYGSRGGGRRYQDEDDYMESY